MSKKKKNTEVISDAGIEVKHDVFSIVVIIVCIFMICLLGYLGVMAFAG